MFVDQTKIIWRQFGEFRQRDEHADENSPFVVDETMMTRSQAVARIADRTAKKSSGHVT